jgi:hypothetical protein
MPWLLAIIMAGSLFVLAAGPALAADPVPTLNTDMSCRGAGKASAAVGPTRDENACKRDELAARDKLAQEWRQFNAAQRSHCVRLSSLGGSPSYVELLTCLELTKAADALPGDGGTGLGKR